MNDTQALLNHIIIMLRSVLEQQTAAPARLMTRQCICLIEAMTPTPQPAVWQSWGDELAEVATVLPAMQSPPENRETKNPTGLV